jgi:hypothetical protein
VALAALCVAAPAQNLLVNGDFEQSDGHGGVAGWSPYVFTGIGTGSLGLAPGYHAKQAATITGLKTPALYGLFSQPVNVTALPGDELLLTCYYKTDGDPQAQVSLVGFADPFLPQEWKAPFLQSETRPLPAVRDWALLSWRFRYVPGVHDLVLVFRVAAQGKLYLDQAALRAYPTEVAVTVTRAGVVDSLPSRRLVELELSNHSHETKNLQVTALALAANRGPLQAGALTSLTPGQSGILRFNYEYDYRLPHTLRLIVADAAGPETYSVQDVPVPGLISARFAAPAFRNTLLSGVPTPKLVVVGAENVTPELSHQLTITAELMSGGTNGDFQGAPAPDGQYRLELKTPALVSGEHAVRVTARLGGEEQVLDLPLHQLSPGGAQVGYDEQGRLWKNGKRMLPRGLYGVTSADEVQEAAAAGCNFVVVASARASYELQAAAATAGLSVVVSAASAADDFWARLNTKWGDSPLTLGWLPYSRPDVRSVAPEDVATLYDGLGRLSPALPVIVTLASPSQAENYTDAADILLAWSLPVPHSPLRALGSMVDTLEQDCRGTKPVWAVIQAAGATASEDLNPTPETPSRPPTAAETTALTYLALVHGAGGVTWYSLDIPDYAGGAAYLMPQDAPDVWAALPGLNLQLRWLTPVLLDGTREALPPVGAIEMARWRYQGGDYVIAVNGSEHGAVTPLTIFTPEAKVQVMFENRSLDADKDGAIQDSFAPFGVHVYAVG